MTFPYAATQQATPVGEATSASQAILERSGHTFIGSVLFLDIVDYSKKAVSEQLEVKDRFNTCLSDALSAVATRDRIILDTGDGAAVNFLGDPEDALLVAMNLVGLLCSPPSGGTSLEVRIGINLGPVRLMPDINGQPNIIGDGINVAQRVMSFAKAGQVLVSRSYHEVVTRLSQEYEQLFAYQGSRTDKHVREHEIYEVSAPVELVQELAARRKSERSAREGPSPAGAAPKGFLHSPALAWGFLSLGAAALAVAAFFSFDGQQSAPAPAKPAAHRAPPPAPVVEAKSVESPAPTPPISTPEPVTQEPPVAAAPEPEPPQPRAHTVHERSKRARVSEQRVARPTALPMVAERAPQPVPAAPEPRTEPPKEVRPEPEAPKAPTLPTQYRAANGPTALVMLAVSPWGEVFVDGRPAGVSPPLAELELSPGKHQIEIRNGTFKPYLADVDVGPNETTRIKHKFLQGR